MGKSPRQICDVSQYTEKKEQERKREREKFIRPMIMQEEVKINTSVKKEKPNIEAEKGHARKGRRPPQQGTVVSL